MHLQGEQFGADCDKLGSAEVVSLIPVPCPSPTPTNSIAMETSATSNC